MVETAYALYLLISIAITIWVAHTLHSEGEVFLIQCFGHNEVLAKSTNHLLVVGFYLVNIGFITLTLSLGDEPSNYAEAIRFLSSKVGLAVLVLGGMHFFNMSAIARFGRKVNDWLIERRSDEAAVAAA
ncbi:MAG TPA: hypothetical protein VGW40_05065 [Allosphingosinicella sp.]|nr:hypothetical protein [Allosphingosinicella sp.]